MDETSGIKRQKGLAAMIGNVSALWRYPASSMGGERLGDIAIGPGGVAGDRLFGIVDADIGDIARPDGRDPRWPKVVQIMARLTATGGLEIATPKSSWMAAPGVEADEAASDFLGFRVSVRPLAGEHPTEPAGQLAQARYVKAPVHLITTASMSRLKALHPAGQPDQRRFRPNIVVEMEAVEGHFPETEWIGRRLAIGEVELVIAEPCRRCGFIMQEQEGLGYDPEILRQLVRHNDHNIGVYCTVDRSGRVAEGDAVRLI